MLVIRLRRIGRKHDPHYRVVVTEHTAPVQGKFIAELGHYHPKSKEVVIREAELMEWIGKGATPSNSVARICDKAGIKHDRMMVKQVQGQPKKKAQELAQAKAEKAAAPAPAEPVEADAPEEAPADDVAEATSPAEEVTEEAVEAQVEEAAAEEAAPSEDAAE